MAAAHQLSAAAALVLALTPGTGPAGVRLDPGGAFIFVSSESRAGGVVDLKTASAPGLAEWSSTASKARAEHRADASARWVEELAAVPARID